MNWPKRLDDPGIPYYDIPDEAADTDRYLVIVAKLRADDPRRQIKEAVEEVFSQLLQTQPNVAQDFVRLLKLERLKPRLGIRHRPLKPSRTLWD